jgi:hypothetical protein
MHYICNKCRKTTYPKRQFDALRDFPSHCDCGEAKELHALFPFALGAEKPDFKVLDVFHAAMYWQDQVRTITFHPFLVVLQRVDNGAQSFWLPYWHTAADGGDVDVEYKAGQFAPVIDAGLFGSLIGQARQKGYLTVAALLAASAVSPEG